MIFSIYVCYFWLFQCLCRALENRNFSSNRPYASSVRSKNNRPVSDRYKSLVEYESCTEGGAFSIGAEIGKLKS